MREDAAGARTLRLPHGNSPCSQRSLQQCFATITALPLLAILPFAALILTLRIQRLQSAPAGG